MPLSTASAPRQRIHTRRIELEGFLREDGLLEVEASLTDVKDVDYRLQAGVRSAGTPLHLMRMRVTLDTAFTILAVEVCSDWVPYPGACETIGAAYQQLVGLSLVRGFRHAVAELFGKIKGCSHITELLQSLPTAAIQTMATFAPDTRETEEKPFQLDQCHALDTTRETVRLYYPRWYRGQNEAEE